MRSRPRPSRRGRSAPTGGRWPTSHWRPTPRSSAGCCTQKTVPPARAPALRWLRSFFRNSAFPPSVGSADIQPNSWKPSWSRGTTTPPRANRRSPPDSPRTHMTDIAERTIDTPSRTLADPPPAKPEGNPSLIALPLIIAGATGVGFIHTGIIHGAAAAVPILLSATAIGLLVTTIWSAALSQNINAIYGTFFGFYGSYAVLSFGLAHN